MFKGPRAGWTEEVHCSVEDTALFRASVGVWRPVFSAAVPEDFAVSKAAFV